MGISVILRPVTEANLDVVRLLRFEPGSANGGNGLNGQGERKKSWIGTIGKSQPKFKWTI